MDQNQLVQVLEQILTPNTEAIKQATETLKKTFLKKPESLPALIHVFITHPNSQVRQLAAVEARSAVPKYWAATPNDTKVQLRDALLQAAINEQNTLVRHSVSRVISEIARIDLADGQWGELIAFLFQASSSDKPENRESGTYILFTVIESLDDDIIQQWRELFELFSRTIKDPQSSAVRLNTLLALGKMAEFITAENPDAVKAFGEVLPAMVAVLKELVDTDDEKKSSNAFEVFQTLLIVESALIQSHFRDLVVFFLEIASAKNIAEAHRCRALSFLMSCLRYKKLKVQALRLGEDITLRALQIITENKPDDDDDDVSREALALIDYLSASLPPSQVVVPLLNVFPQYTSNPDPAHRRAGVLALGMCVEGAPEFLSTQIESILPTVLSLLGDSVLEVRRAALTTIARLADDLPEEIGNAHERVIPLLIAILDSNDGKDTWNAACGAIESALLGVDEEDVKAYLPELMPRLNALFQKDDAALKASAIGAVGSAASSSKEAFLPYFEGIMSAISPYINGKDTEDELDLRAVIVEALCYIANAVGPQAFTPYVQPLMDSAKEGLHLEHSRLKETSFMFFSALARVYGEDFTPFLDTVVNALIESLEQEETDLELLGQHGSVLIDKVGLEGSNMVSLNGNGQVVDISGDEDDGFEDEEDLWEEIDSVNALALEKEVAAETLGEILSNCKRGFVPYLLKTVGILASKTEHPYEGVRGNAIGTLYRAYASFFQLFEEQTNTKWEPGLPLKNPPSNDVKQLGELVTGCTLKMLKEERERSCVTEICNNISETLKLCGPALIEDENVITEFVTQIVLILKKQHACQQDLDEDEADLPDVGDTAEYDWMLIEAAMDMIVGFAAALGPQFIKIWEPFGHLLLRYLSGSEAVERSASVGIIADCIKHMGGECTPLTPELFKLIMHRLSDEDAKTKSHSAYAMGMLALKTNNKQEIINAYPEIFQKLEPLLEGIAGSNARTRDNAAGCIARMITAAPQAVNLEEIFPALIKVLPLKDDYEENEPIYEMLIPLYQANNETVLKYTPQLLPVFNEVLSDEDQLEEETRNKLVELIKYLHTKDSAAIDSYPTLAAAARA